MATRANYPYCTGVKENAIEVMDHPTGRSGFIVCALCFVPWASTPAMGASAATVAILDSATHDILPH